MVLHQPKTETHTHTRTHKTMVKRTFYITLNYHLVFFDVKPWFCGQFFLHSSCKIPLLSTNENRYPLTREK